MPFSLNLNVMMPSLCLNILEKRENYKAVTSIRIQFYNLFELWHNEKNLRVQPISLLDHFLQILLSECFQEKCLIVLFLILIGIFETLPIIIKNCLGLRIIMLVWHSNHSLVSHRWLRKTIKNIDHSLSILQIHENNHKGPRLLIIILLF